MTLDVRNDNVREYPMLESMDQLPVQDLEYWQDLVENVNDLIQSVRPDGSLLYVNRAWCETLGYSREEAARLSAFDVIHPGSRGHCEAIFRRVMAGERVDHVETTFVTKDGRAVVVEVSANCRFQDGQPVATRTILRDITERKRAEAELRLREERYRSLVTALEDMVWNTGHRKGGYERLIIDWPYVRAWRSNQCSQRAELHPFEKARPGRHGRSLPGSPRRHR